MKQWLKKRLNKWNKPAYDIIVVQGEWYYLTRDNYPFKTLRAYINHAVRVHVNTGELIQPE